jgi:DNA-binding SARP family transcriptional activator
VRNITGVLTIRLFGHARFEIDEAAWPFRAPAKAIAVLAYLATHQDVPVSRNFLAELIWPDDEPEDGRGKLRRHLHVLVGALPKAPEDAPYLLSTMQTVRWNQKAPATVDTIAFCEAGANDRLDDATAWYGGDFLETHHDEWVLTERERLRNLQLGYLRASLLRKRSERDLSGALADVAHILAIDSWREDAIRTEMRLRSQLGDRSGALAAYLTFAQRLRAELDAEPTPETRAVYEALARGEALTDDEGVPRTSAAAAHAPVALPFTGRQAEFESLASAWSSAARGKGSMTLMSGEAGAGKSRLAQELALHVESQGGGVLLGSTTPGEARPYEAVIDALRSALSLVISSQSPAELGVLARVLPEIAARATIVEAPAASPEAERLRIFEAVYSAIAALARKRPLLVVLEDLHWTTASSAALIEYLVRRISVLPVLVVGTYREEDVGRAHPLRGLRRRLESEGTLERIALPRFDLAAVVEIARRVFAGRPDIETLANELYAYSEGVPLFLDEAIHAPDRASAGPRLNVPARVERLGESAHVLLEIAAVAGTSFNIDVICEVAGWNEADVLRALDELVEARFVREGRRRRFGDYAFSHHLVHAAVYEGIGEVQRRRRHALVARVWTTLYEERPDAAGEIALHYDRAGDAPRAARSYAAAAHHARSLYANEEALAHAERAIALADDEELLVDMQLIRAWAGNALGWSATRSGAADALAHLAITARQLPEVERFRTMHAMLEGRFDVARNAAQRLIDAARAVDDAASVVQGYIESGTIAIAGDRYADAEDHLRLAGELMPAADDVARLRLMRAQTFLAQRRGAHDAELSAAAQRLLAEAQRLGDPQSEAEAHVRLAHVDMTAHRFADARLHYDGAVEAYRRFGSPRGVDSVQNNCASLALWTAEYESAKTLYGRCLAFAEDNNDEANLFTCAIGVTLASIYTADLAQATTHAESVAHLYRGSGRLEEANWHLCRALIATENGDAESATGAYDAALAIHRTKPPTSLFALTLALAALMALDAGDVPRALALDGELGHLSEEILSGEEFPHLMYWSRSRAASLHGDETRAKTFLLASERLYEARISALGPGGAAFAAVPWNVRFLAARAARSDAFQTLPS